MEAIGGVYQVYRTICVNICTNFYKIELLKGNAAHYNGDRCARRYCPGVQAIRLKKALEKRPPLLKPTMAPICAIEYVFSSMSEDVKAMCGMLNITFHCCRFYRKPKRP